MSEDACRIDVWLWRARFCKTRGLAAKLVEDGRVKMRRHGGETTLDKPSRALRVGDALTLLLEARQVSVRIEALGERRGPAPEARALYGVLDDRRVGRPDWMSLQAGSPDAP